MNEEKSDNSSKSFAFLDSALVLAMISGVLFFVGRAHFEGFYEEIGVPVALLDRSIEGMIHSGSLASVNWIIFLPAAYLLLLFVRKPICEWVVKVHQEDKEKWYSGFFAGALGYTLFCALLLSPILFLSSFIEKGRERGKAYLEDPIRLRFKLKESPKNMHEAILLARNNDQYFLRWNFEVEEVGFVVIGKAEMSGLAVLNPKTNPKNEVSSAKSPHPEESPRDDS